MGGTVCRFDRKPDQVAKAKFPIPGCLVKQVLRAIQEAEDKIGRPVNAVEASQQLYKTSGGMLNLSAPIIAQIFSSLILEDIIYTNSIMSY